MHGFGKHRVKPGDKIDLAKTGSNDTHGWTKHKAAEQTKLNLARIAELQDVLYAEKKRGLLIVLQAMDTGGKDGTVKTIGGAMNPAGVRVVPFKAPTSEERAHDFLWRVEKQVPKAGEVVIFNRSHYEDVGIVRVHKLVDEKTWRDRYDIINDFEKDLAAKSADVPEGTLVLKFFLHIGPDEQWNRFRDRATDPAKQWKLSEADMHERQFWSGYMEAYSDAISKCSTEEAPWFVVPADNKWMRDLIISQIVVDQLEALNMQYPKPAANIEELRQKYFSDDKKGQKPPKPGASFNKL